MTADAREARVAAILSAARASGRRMTRQREAVVRALVLGGGHSGVGERYDRLRTRLPGISRATVYKTLEMLESLHEVLELDFGEGHGRYEAVRPQSHPHLACTGCGAIEDLFAERLDEYLTGISNAAGYRVERYRIDFYRKCPRCRAAEGIGPSG